MKVQEYKAVVMGASSGGMEAIGIILSRLPEGFLLPILIVQHLHPTDDTYFAQHLDKMSDLSVQEACDKALIRPSRVYVAPANYHLLVERDGTLALSVDEKVNWSRPSIDVLFESAAHVWRERLVAVILSGANNDGAEGIRVVKKLGGMAIAQDPETADQPIMPRAAIEVAGIETVLSPENIAGLLFRLSEPIADKARAASTGNSGEGADA